jgi:hypothetical protein
VRFADAGTDDADAERDVTHERILLLAEEQYVATKNVCLRWSMGRRHDR